MVTNIPIISIILHPCYFTVPLGVPLSVAEGLAIGLSIGLKLYILTTNKKNMSAIALKSSIVTKSFITDSLISLVSFLPFLSSWKEIGEIQYQVRE